MLKQYLLADLGRQFELEGRTEKASVPRLILRALHHRFLPLLLCRCARATWLRATPILPKLFTYLNILLFGIEIAPQCEIGPGLFLPHTTGTVIGAARVGRNATIFQGVTLGAKTLDMGFHPEIRPVVGSDVTLGAGAKVLGGIHIGDDVTVGANSVVISDTAPGLTVVGIPAQPVSSASKQTVGAGEKR
jgi:serine O-acetyltransferase